MKSNSLKKALSAFLVLGLLLSGTAFAKSDLVFTGEDQNLSTQEYKSAFKAYNAIDFITLMQVVEADESPSDRITWYWETSLATDREIDEMVHMYATMFYDPETATLLTLGNLIDIDTVAETYGETVPDQIYPLSASISEVLRSIYPAGYFETGDMYDAIRQASRGLYWYTLQHNDAPGAEVWRQTLGYLMQMYIQEMINQTSTQEAIDAGDIPADAQ